MIVAFRRITTLLNSGRVSIPQFIDRELDSRGNDVSERDQEKTR